MFIEKLTVFYKSKYDMSLTNSLFSAQRWTSDYHFKLSLVYSAPKQVFRYGNIELLHKQILAIVGPRQCSPYAKQVMEELFRVLPQYDLVTISGLADGVDMMAHEMSIAANIPTIAVLGGGLERFLKSKSREMIHKIVKAGGLVISEFALDKAPERYTFPQRNRIVAGLADAVFLPEAGAKSGSLITADFARQMYKPVYGAPSTIFSLSSKGLLEYMQQGLVVPVVDWHWMLGKYFWKRAEELKVWKAKSGLFDVDEQENNKVLEILKKNPDWLTMNELVRESGLGIDKIMGELGILEVMGKVRMDEKLLRVVEGSRRR